MGWGLKSLTKNMGVSRDSWSLQPPRHQLFASSQCLGSISVILLVLLLFPEEVQRLISRTDSGNRAVLMLNVENSPFRR